MAGAKNKLKIKKGDLVQVITGRKQDKGGDRGKQGKVLQVFPDRRRVLVEGVNRVTVHKKVGQGGNGQTSGIEVREAPIHISNVALVDPSTKAPTRVGYRLDEVERDGRKRTVRVRVSKRSGEDI